MNYGPYVGMPGTPWYGTPGSRGGIGNGAGGGAGGGGGGTRQPPANFSFSDIVSVKSRFSANPGVLVSGRRPERPGKT